MHQERPKLRQALRMAGKNQPFVIGMLIFLGAIISSWMYGDKASSNPWGSKSLEWQTPTPVPLENFEVLPVVTERPYEYGVPDPYQKELDAVDGDLEKVGK